ncbi:cupin domain-containing protein [Aspergillus homomorphus CBS 101889]|uniref:Cupin 2 conserved barrel domain-containing protein n=1 Tax=Aspergillus homomorphus (strain CBS 101889) TaxID=1450537 RepID=A0A395IAV9_ASPHC|nr:hypothetical protein BO97DRAFT_334152 [Aspergillus homomorphus CBS 101889]RAL17390.1 hypothetical protein BO97DRAFT_334152 [Aspergillus homomorphus CBS 101889]
MPNSAASPLPAPRRIVAGHNDAGFATVKHDSQIHPQPVGDGINLALLWTSTEHPADALVHPGVPPTGSGFSAYDLPPQSVGVFHRSSTLDYVIVGKGSVVLGLDGGTRVTLNEEDVLVQRATMHSWNNVTDQWARAYGIMLPARAPCVSGEEL